MSEIREAVEQAMAICRVAGCQFTPEEEAQMEKVKAGEMTLDEMTAEFMKKIQG